MPRIFIQVIAPNTEFDQQTLSFDDLSFGLSLGELKSFVNAETNIAPESQSYFLNNRPVSAEDQKTLQDIGLKDEDMLAMVYRPPGQQNNMGAQRSQQSRQQRTAQGQSEQEIERMRQSILQNPSAMMQLRDQRPALAEAINDSARFRDALVQMEQEAGALRNERLQQIQALNDAEFDIESQRKIEEMIRQESVQENLQFAYEYNPEVFARVTMLYIPVQVNKHPIKAFVDSGAQTTIMSPSCAESCGIMRLIDKRYSGVARGVGTAQILGRVHSAPITIGNSTMSCSFTVMEGKDVDLLLGLDMLKRFQAVIDLKQNKLVFGDGNEVAFLGEADIPKYLEDALESEPTVKGPNGTEVGAQSGTIKPAGTSAAATSSSSANGAFRGQGQTLGAAASSSASTSSKAPASDVQGRAQAPPSSAAPALRPAQPQSKYPKESIDQLVSLGFSNSEAFQALEACDGNVEYAASLLFGLPN